MLKSTKTSLVIVLAMLVACDRLDHIESIEALATNGVVCVSPSDCASGFCVDGLCCDADCGGGFAKNCQSCEARLTGLADGTCGIIQAGVKFACRPAAGACDVPEFCDGASNACPSTDAIRPSGAVCRPLSGVCDVAEVCDGVSVECPADAVRPPGILCKGSGANQVCDPADHCDGLRKLCPASYAPAGTSCGTGMSCNGAGQCR